MKQLVRKNILSLKSYVAGKPIEETKRELGLKEVIKLASNENPLGASPKAIKAIQKNLFNINRYPDSRGFYLREKLARSLNIQAENIVLGNGSDELIDIIIKTFVEDDENIITSNTTFLEYEIISWINAKQICTVRLKDFKYDLAAIRKKIDRKTKLIFIANPNNPTGTYVNKSGLKEFIDYLPENVLLVLDEAYDTFIDVKDFSSGLSYFNKKNVIVLKTFSKAYGLAGLRIGYAIANKGFSSYMDRVRQPFNVNILAQAAAISALDDKDFLRKTKEMNLSGKKYLYDSLDRLGIVYVPSVTNFILIRTCPRINRREGGAFTRAEARSEDDGVVEEALRRGRTTQPQAEEMTALPTSDFRTGSGVGRDGVAVFKEMLKYGVIVRDMRQYGLKDFIRVTIGREKENKRFIKTLKKVLNC